MTNLNQFDVAQHLSEILRKGDEVFVRITEGRNVGSILPVISIKRNHYSSHAYSLRRDCGKTLVRNGNTLEVIQDYTGEARWVDSNTPPEYQDSLGTQIEVGQIINYYRKGSSTNIEIVFAVVKEITNRGVFVDPFRVGDQCSTEFPRVRLLKPTCSCVIHDQTYQELILNKLSA